MSSRFARICSRLVAAGVLLTAWSAGAFETLWVQSQTPGGIEYRITGYDMAGETFATAVPVQAPASTDVWHPRDLVLAPDGTIHLFDGTFDPYLSTRNAESWSLPDPGSWSHVTHPGWTTANSVADGGIARVGSRVFLTSTDTAGNPSLGVVVFDLNLGTSASFGAPLEFTDLNLGLDGWLWALDESDVAHAFDPDTLAAQASVSMDAAGSDVRSIAVDANGDFYVATWGGVVSRLAPDGSLVDSLALGGNLLDIDVSEEGWVAVGTRTDGVWLTDTSLAAPEAVDNGDWNSFVTFLPEVHSPSALAWGGALVWGLRRRRALGR